MGGIPLVSAGLILALVGGLMQTVGTRSVPTREGDMWQRIGWLALAVVGGIFVGLLLSPGTPAWATHEPTHGCPPDSVRVGTACIDKFEASVWEVPADKMDRVKWVALIGRIPERHCGRSGI